MLLKALLISIYAGIAGIDMFDGLTHIHRPLVSGLVVGLILGNVEMGVIAGATLELVWMGAVPIGGAQPPNVVVGGIIGSAFAILSKLDATAAVGIAIPFAVAVQACITLLFTFFSPMMHVADGYAERADEKGIAYINYLGMGILFVFYFTVTFLPLAAGEEAAIKVVSLLHPTLIAGFGVAGGMMPGIGFAMLLNIMFKKDYIIFFALGFILASYLKLPILPIAAIGLIIAIYDYSVNSKMDSLAIEASVKEVDYSDGI